MKDVYKNRYGEDISDDSVKKLYSVAVSIFAIGGMLGGFSGGIIANRFGRLVYYLLSRLFFILTVHQFLNCNIRIFSSPFCENSSCAFFNKAVL